MASVKDIELPTLAVPQSAHTSGKDSTTLLQRRSTRASSSQAALLNTNEPGIVRTTTSRTVEQGEIGKGASFIVITCVTCITGISALLAGLVTVMLPAMAVDLHLAENLQLWPASIYALTCGCTLLILGSITDVVGSRNMYLLGCALQSAFTLACGLSRSGMQLIVFRALAGIAISFCLPSSVSLVTNLFEPGKRRNVAFAAMGGGQPIGFSIGLTLGGVFVDSIGWRWGFYTGAILNTVILVTAIWGLPKMAAESEPITWRRLRTEIDWIGAIIASSSIALMSYDFAVLAEDASKIKDPTTLALLIISIVLIPAFIFWCGRQERLGRPAIIPNSLWRNKVFTSICINVFVTWGVFNAMENFLSFYFQSVQHISALQSSVRFLPAPASGAFMNIFMGLFVHRVSADILVITAAIVACGAPLVMALASRVDSTYWSASFWGVLLNPVGADTLFTVSNLLITSLFPQKTQGLAGGVFNTMAQIGKSFGLATSAIVAATATQRSSNLGKASPEALLDGYHAAWWYNFAQTLLLVFVSIWGLRKIGKVGKKRE